MPVMFGNLESCITFLRYQYSNFSSFQSNIFIFMIDNFKNDLKLHI